MKKRFLAFFLSLAMCLSMLPMNAMAEDIEEGDENSTIVETENESDPDQSESDQETEGVSDVSDDSEKEEEEEIIEETFTAQRSLSSGFSQSLLTLVTDKKSTLATGVTQDLYTVYDKNGDQVKMFAATMDMNVSTVKLYTAYKNMDNSSYGMSKLTEQVASFNEKAAAGDEYYQGKVVAGINTSYYNMTTGKPLGAFVMNGNDVTTGNEGDNYGYFAVMKDGSVKIGNVGEFSSDKKNIQEAFSIQHMLIVDGKIVEGLDSTKKYPRQTIGITKDNKVIILTADGNQAPTSIGLTMEEQAQVMADLGCVWAGHLDGGGSATYGSKAEGADDFKVVNKPADGSERSISNGLIVVSQEEQSNAFARVSFDTEYEYITPGSSMSVSVSGVSSSGNSADIPGEVTYQVTNGSYSEGVFTAGEDLGNATITAIYNGQEVGSVSVNVVVPDSIGFSSDTITVPYGKTTTLDLVAKYGVNKVKTNESDYSFTLENEAAGVIDGLLFTACDESSEITETVITATLTGSDITDQATMKFGKGSEEIITFEDADSESYSDLNLGYSGYNYYLPNGNVSVVDASTGKVHSGDKALALNIDYSNSLESGYMMTALKLTADQDIVGIGAKSLGMWIYIPEDFVGLWGRWVVSPIESIAEDGTPVYAKSTITSQTYDGQNGATGVVSSFNESGWHYVSVDLSAYKGGAIKKDSYFFQFYISDRDGAGFNYYFKNQHNVNGNYTVYIDDITFDYSDVVVDREAPIFSDMTYATNKMSDAAKVEEGAAIEGNEVDFSASVEENTKKTNATGIDASTAKAYVDGNEVSCTYANGIISMDKRAKLNAGSHIIKFSICDKQGNYASIIRNIEVTSGEGVAIKVVAHDPDADRVLLDSVNYVDVVASNIENIKSVTTKLNLDSMSKWQLDHMDVAEGFEATYSLETTTNDAILTITRTGSNSAEGEAVLVSIPVRAWTLENSNKQAATSTKEWTLKQFRDSKEFWPIAIDLSVDQGSVTLTDGTAESFAGDNILIWTEMWANYANMTATAEGKAYYESWNGGHIHTAEAIDDLAPTCTKAGYTGRTFCSVCNSVVEWGTAVQATGHTYEFGTDGILKCKDCDTLFTGTWTDGKEYVDGSIIADGWKDDCYYVGGVKITGVQEIDGVYYDFGEDGICQGKYTGLFYDNNSGVYRYAQVGELSSGWKQIEDDWYYFAEDTLAAVSGEMQYGVVTYSFSETGCLTTGVWYTTGNGTRYYYGPDYYRNKGVSNAAWVTIDGKRYAFDSEGFRFEGVRGVVESNANAPVFYDFGEDGVCVGEYTGIVTYKNNSYYSVAGEIQYCGLFEYNGALYYADHNYGKLIKDQDYYVYLTNGLLTRGTYHFDENGKIVLKQGIIDDYYYIDGEIQYCGLFEYDGAFYYADHNYGKLIKNQDYYVYVTNGLLDKGTYHFDENGKIVFEQEDIKQGIVNGYYYVDGEVQYCGLFEYDGAFYYADHNYGNIIKDRDYYVYVTNGLLPRGTYHFDENGKIVLKQGIIDGYYYVDGKIQYCGLFEYDGAFYYADHNYGNIIMDRDYYVYVTNGLLPRGTYHFDENGKIVLKQGIIDGYYYVDGKIQYCGLFEYNGALYYADHNYGKLIKDQDYYVYVTNGLVERGTYHFDENGKIVLKQGIIDGYYYVDGKIQYCGLFEYNGALYYADHNYGKLIKDQDYYVYVTNGLVKRGTYHFDENGKMIITQ